MQSEDKAAEVSDAEEAASADALDEKSDDAEEKEDAEQWRDDHVKEKQWTRGKRPCFPTRNKDDAPMNQLQSPPETP